MWIKWSVVKLNSPTSKPKKTDKNKIYIIRHTYPHTSTNVHTCRVDSRTSMAATAELVVPRSMPTTFSPGATSARAVTWISTVTNLWQLIDPVCPDLCNAPPWKGPGFGCSTFSSGRSSHCASSCHGSSTNSESTVAWAHRFFRTPFKFLPYSLQAGKLPSRNQLRGHLWSASSNNNRELAKIHDVVSHLTLRPSLVSAAAAFQLPMGHRGKYLLKDVEGTMWLKWEPQIPKHYANNIQQCGNSHARSRKPCRLPSQQLAHDEQLILSMLMGLHLCAFFHDASLIRCFTSQKPGLWILNDFNCLVFFSCSVFLCFSFFFLFGVSLFRVLQVLTVQYCTQVWSQWVWWMARDEILPLDFWVFL